MPTRKSQRRSINRVMSSFALTVAFAGMLVLYPARCLAVTDETKSMHAQTPAAVPDMAAQWREVDHRKAQVKHLVEKAGRGDVAAALRLGRIFREGLCVTPDFAEARRWLDVAARSGDPEALLQLARMQDQGEGGAIDPAGSIKNLEAAAETGSVEAALSLGLAYLRGDRIAPDAKKARSWLERAKASVPKNGSAIADEVDLTVGWMLKTGVDGLADPVAARAKFEAVLKRDGWLDKLEEELENDRPVGAASGYAMLELARSYEMGIGSAANFEQAIRWYKAATESTFEKLAATKLASLKGTWSQSGWPDRPFDLLALQEYLQGAPRQDLYPDRGALDLLLPPGRALAAPARRTVDELLAKAAAGDGDLCFYAGLMALNGWGIRKDASVAVQWLEKAAAKGHHGAPMLLGTMAYQGVGGPRNVGRAHEWYEKALGRMMYYEHSLFVRDFLVADGKKLAPDFAARLDALEQAAKSGDAAAQLKRARQFRLALGEMPDALEAIRWYAAAARQGQPAAYYELAEFYEQGVAVMADRDEGLRLQRKAAAAGHAMAASDLAIAHAPWSGWDAPKSPREEQRWWRRLAELGMQQGTMSLIRQLEREQNYAEIAKWYELAGAQGAPWAKVALADMYRIGRGVPRDLVRARAMYEATRGTEAEAKYQTGLMWELGLGGPADLAKAEALYRQAAEDSVQEAMFRLGLMYEEGRGFKRNDAEARKWYEAVIENETAEGGPEAEVTHEARFRLARMYEEGRGGAKDLKKALDYYRWSGSAGAVKRLGELLEKGATGKPDRAAALKVYRDWLHTESFWHGPDLQFLERPIREECLPEGMSTVAALLERAERTDPRARTLLGRLLEEGVGVPHAPLAARRLFEAAASKGYAEGHYRIALQEDKGILGVRSESKAAQAFRAAVGAARPRYEEEVLGGGESDAYLEALRWLYKVRDDVTPLSDPRENSGINAVFVANEPGIWRLLFERAEVEGGEELDVFDSWLLQGRLGFEMTGMDIEQLHAKASAGSLSARLLLLVRHIQAGDQAAFEKEYPAVRAAAEAGQPRAQFMVGSLLAAGKMLKKDPVAAHVWLNLAAASGHKPSAHTRHALTPTLSMEEREAAERRALELWRRYRATLM